MRRAELWLCVTAAFVGGVVGGGLFGRAWPEVAALAAAANPPQTVTANKFVLVDDSGRQRGLIEADSNGPAYIVLNDPNGKRRVGIGAELRGAALNLFDADGVTLRAALRQKPDGDSELVIVDGRGQIRSGLAVTALGIADAP